MTLRALIFDRDGVLTFFEFGAIRSKLEQLGWSLELVLSRWERFYRGRALPRDRAQEREFIGEFWSVLCEEHGVSGAGRDEMVNFDYTTLVRPFDDARPALERARAMGLRTAVLSNFPFVRIEDSLASVGLASLVDGAFAAAVIGVSKPAPGSYLHVASALGVAPSECALIDDERECVDGAARVGMRAFWLDRRGLGPLSPDRCVSLSDLIERIALDVERAPEHSAPDRAVVSRPRDQ